MTVRDFPHNYFGGHDETGKLLNVMINTKGHPYRVMISYKSSLNNITLSSLNIKFQGKIALKTNQFRIQIYAKEIWKGNHEELARINKTNIRKTEKILLSIEKYITGNVQPVRYDDQIIVWSNDFNEGVT